MKRASLLVALALISSSAFARIGETLDECLVRYGPSTEPPAGIKATAGTYYFQKNDFTISAIMLPDGKTIGSIIYSSHSPISREKIEALLENNAQASRWHLDDAATGQAKSAMMRKEIIYKRDDGGAEATYSEIGEYNGLHIRSKTFIRSRSTEVEGL